jgi:hypothetical protein
MAAPASDARVAWATAARYDAPMFSRTWVAQVYGGLSLVVVFGALAIVVGVQEAARSAPPVALSVAEAGAQVEAVEQLDHVRLTDLVLGCDDLGGSNNRIYARARGEQPEPVVLVEFHWRDGCKPGPLSVAGTLQHPPQALELELQITGVPRVLLLRPHASHRVGLVIWAALAILGVGLVAYGVRRRRDELERLRRTMEAGPVLIPETGQEGDPYRQEQGAGRLLPRPLRPDERWFRRARRGPLVRAVLGGLLLALGLLWAGFFTFDAVRMHVVWSGGEPASAVRVAGLREEPVGFAAQRKPVVTHHDLAVAYTDAGGVRHHGTYSRWALAVPIYKGEPLEVRYDHDDPSSFALSLVVESFHGELMLILLVLAILVPVSLGMIREPRLRLRELAQIRETLHSDPEEVIFPVLSVHRHEVKDKLVSTEYNLELPDGATMTESFPDGERPLFVELDESRVLGLRRRGPSGHVIVLRDDLSPLAADEHEDERVRLRHRRASERPGT